MTPPSTKKKGVAKRPASKASKVPVKSTTAPKPAAAKTAKAEPSSFEKRGTTRKENEQRIQELFEALHAGGYKDASVEKRQSFGGAGRAGKWHVRLAPEQPAAELDNPSQIVLFLEGALAMLTAL